jgi:hypothetical protein
VILDFFLNEKASTCLCFTQTVSYRQGYEMKTPPRYKVKRKQRAAANRACCYKYWSVVYIIVVVVVVAATRIIVTVESLVVHSECDLVHYFSTL